MRINHKNSSPGPISLVTSGNTSSFIFDGVYNSSAASNSNVLMWSANKVRSSIKLIGEISWECALLDDWVLWQIKKKEMGNTIIFL